MKIILIILGVILLAALFVTKCMKLGPAVRKPESSVPFIYQIGWWPYQEDMEVTSLKIKLLDSRLNLFNGRSLVSLAISGKMRTDKGWRPYIKSVHISEQVIKGGNFAGCRREIRVTPLVGVREDNNYNGELLPFVITQELILFSMGWGKNRFTIISQDQNQEIEVIQKK